MFSVSHISSKGSRHCQPEFGAVRSSACMEFWQEKFHYCFQVKSIGELYRMMMMTVMVIPVYCIMQRVECKLFMPLAPNTNVLLCLTHTHTYILCCCSRKWGTFPSQSLSLSFSSVKKNPTEFPAIYNSYILAPASQKCFFPSLQAKWTICAN